MCHTVSHLSLSGMCHVANESRQRLLSHSLREATNVMTSKKLCITRGGFWFFFLSSLMDLKFAARLLVGCMSKSSTSPLKLIFQRFAQNEWSLKIYTEFEWSRYQKSHFHFGSQLTKIFLFIREASLNEPFLLERLPSVCRSHLVDQMGRERQRDRER